MIVAGVRASFLALLIGAMSFVFMVDPGAPAVSAGAPIAFGPPTISGIQGFGFEPDLRVQGERVYTSSPGTLASTISWLWRSTDGGKTFKWIPASTPMTGKLPTCIGGGDTELAVDSGGHLYFNDLTLANFSTARSDDQGVSLTPPTCTSVNTSPDDRQWYATDGDPTNGGNLYLAYNVPASNPTVCNGVPDTRNVLTVARSPANGALGADAGIHFAPAQSVVGGCDEGIMGPNEVSPLDHRIYVPHDNAAFDAISVARCDAVPFSALVPSGLSCADFPVASFPGSQAGSSFPALTIDSAGNVYVAWEQTPVDGSGGATGDTLLFWSSSTNGGTTWTPPVQIPTPGQHNNIFVSIAAGDAGRVDIAWYGTKAEQHQHPDPSNTSTCSGPGTAVGDWNLWFSQTIDATASSPTFSSPIDAGEHFFHRGGGFSLIGRDPNDLCNSRIQLGDFFQLRTGPDGEANVIFVDSNNRTGLSHNMFVKQISGTGVLAAKPQVPLQAAPVNAIGDPANDATYDANSVVSANRKQFDILGSSMTRLDSSVYRITMTVADLTNISPLDASGDVNPVGMWMTQWIAPSKTMTEGGKNFFVAMETNRGSIPRFLLGQTSFTTNGGAIWLTYPGAKVIDGNYTATVPGIITIDVKLSDVAVPDPIDAKLYSVTSATMTLPAASDSAGSGAVSGVLFNLIDVAPAYDHDPSGPAGTGCICPLADTGTRSSWGVWLLMLVALLALSLINRRAASE
ncbi:MAG: hypothetical protein ABR507_09855 [Actinomycetota bacterium]